MRSTIVLPVSPPIYDQTAIRPLNALIKERLRHERAT